MIYRALTISEPASLDGELEHLSINTDQALNKNGYSNKDIDRTTQRLKNKISGLNITKQPEKEEEKKKTAVLPNIQGTTERISRILGKHNIRVIFKSQRKVSQALLKPKDETPPLETPGVYKILAPAEKYT